MLQGAAPQLLDSVEAYIADGRARIADGKACIADGRTSEDAISKGSSAIARKGSRTSRQLRWFGKCAFTPRFKPLKREERAADLTGYSGMAL